MDRRLQFQTILEELLGSRNVYFQPEENIQMVYPAIVYNLDYLNTKHGNNNPYNVQIRYSVTHIARKPNSDLVLKLANLPKSNFDRAFKSDGLNHTSFNIYY